MFGVELPQSIYPLVPGYADFSLRKKTAAASPDTFAAAVTVRGRLKDASTQEIIRANVVTEEPLYMISVYDIGETGFVAPSAEDEIVDSAGVKYRVRHVGTKVLATLYKCVCSRKRTQ